MTDFYTSAAKFDLIAKALRTTSRPISNMGAAIGRGFWDSKGRNHDSSCFCIARAQLPAAAGTLLTNRKKVCMAEAGQLMLLANWHSPASRGIDTD